VPSLTRIAEGPAPARSQSAGWAREGPWRQAGLPPGSVRRGPTLPHLSLSRQWRSTPEPRAKPVRA
jgi:hypothetical protein